MYKHYQPWSLEDEHRAIAMRKACVNPEIIAETLERSVAGVRQKLHLSGIEFPMLRRSHLKYDKAAVKRWREMQKAGISRQEIYETEGVHPVIISRKYAQDIHNELVF